MKRHITLFLMLAFVLSVFGCAEKEASVPATSEKTEKSSEANAVAYEAISETVDVFATPEPTETQGELYREEDGSVIFSEEGMWAELDKPYIDSESASCDFDMSADEFVEKLIQKYGLSDCMTLKVTSKTSQKKLKIKKGVMSVCKDDSSAIVLLFNQDTYNLNTMKIILFNGGYVSFKIYNMGDILYFGRTYKQEQNYNGAVYLKEHNDEIYLFVESSCEVDSLGYMLKVFKIEGGSLVLYSDLNYDDMNDSLTSDRLPLQLLDLYKSDYNNESLNSQLEFSGRSCILYQYILEDCKYYTDNFDSLKEAVAAYFNCFGIGRDTIVNRKYSEKQQTELEYGQKGVTKIFDFYLRNVSESGNYVFGLNDYTDIHK